MLKLKNVSLQALCVTCSTLLIGCGGGSSGSNDPVAPLEPTITSLNAVVTDISAPVVITLGGTHLSSAVTLSMADASCQSPTIVSSTSLQVACTVSSGGTKDITIKASSSGKVIDEGRVLYVPQSAKAAGNIPHSGTTSAQCYKLNSSALFNCAMPETVDYSGAGKQDGMYVKRNPRSYARVGNYPVTSCVRDLVTGLVWEGKEVDGPRAANIPFTNYDNPEMPQKMDGVSMPTVLEITATTNAAGYVNFVNEQSLCGFNDWRLPTAKELETLVDAGKKTGPIIDPEWFPNSTSRWHWTSTPYVGGYSQYAWFVSFEEGNVYYDNRALDYAVRLVRSPQ